MLIVSFKDLRALETERRELGAANNDSREDDDQDDETRPLLRR